MMRAGRSPRRDSNIRRRAMEPVIVDLPPELQRVVESGVVKATWDKPADFLRHLVEQVHDRWNQEMEKIADEAMSSGAATPWTAHDVSELKERLRMKHGAE